MDLKTVNKKPATKKQVKRPRDTKDVDESRNDRIIKVRKVLTDNSVGWESPNKLPAQFFDYEMIKEILQDKDIDALQLRSSWKTNMDFRVRSYNDWMETEEQFKEMSKIYLDEVKNFLKIGYTPNFFTITRILSMYDKNKPYYMKKWLNNLFKLLLSNVVELEDYVLDLAIDNLNIDIVRHLLNDGRIDPSYESNSLLENVVKYTYKAFSDPSKEDEFDKLFDIIQMLIQDSRVDWRIAYKYLEFPEITKRREDFVKKLTQIILSLKTQYPNEVENNIRKKIAFETAYAELCNDLNRGLVPKVELVRLAEILNLDIADSASRREICRQVRLKLKEEMNQRG